MGISIYTPDSTKILHAAYADFVSRQIARPVHVVQYDDGLPILAVKLFADGQPYTVPANADINIKLGKPDGKFVYNQALGCDSARHVVYFEITYQMVILAEKVSPVVEVIIGDSVSASSPIGIVIDRNPVQKDAIESTSEWKMIQQAVQYTKESIAAAASASASRSAAKTSETNAANSASAAGASASRAATSETNAANSASAAGASASRASTSETNAASSASAAGESASRAATSEINAANSASAAGTSETNAKASEENIKGCEDACATYAKIAKSYAVGDAGYRENENTDNAQYYYQQARRISDELGDILIPMGTIAFADLPTQMKSSGHMFNISDEFTSDGTFKDGGGLKYPAGTNVYYTADGYWDCFAGSMASDIQEQLQQQYEQLTGYTDTKIGELINGAPETLDTIKEVADAILENETVVEALNEAVGKKLNKDGDLTDATATFTSEDDENPTAWTAMRKIVSGKVKDILGNVSIMAKNLNYLRKVLGTHDISKLGDGTVTSAISTMNGLMGATKTPLNFTNIDYTYPDGDKNVTVAGASSLRAALRDATSEMSKAVVKLNTDLQGMDGIKYIDFGAYDGSKKTLDDVVKEILNNFPLALNNTYIGYFVMGPTYRIIIQPFRERTHASAIVFSYATKGVVFYTKIVNNVKKYTASWDETAI